MTQKKKIKCFTHLHAPTVGRLLKGHVEFLEPIARLVHVGHLQENKKCKYTRACEKEDDDEEEEEEEINNSTKQ